MAFGLRTSPNTTKGEETVSKVDKKRHAELSERVDDLTIKLEEAEQDRK